MPAQYRNQNQIIATGDKDTPARQIWGHFFYKFSRKCPATIIFVFTDSDFQRAGSG